MHSKAGKIRFIAFMPSLSGTARRAGAGSRLLPIEANHGWLSGARVLESWTARRRARFMRSGGSALSAFRGIAASLHDAVPHAAAPG
jgi:hypothetical protein